MIPTNIHARTPNARHRTPIARARRFFTGTSVSRRREERGWRLQARGAGRNAGLFGNLEGGLLLTPPDFPFVRRGPLFFRDVLVGFDDGLLDVFHPGPDGVVVALLALVVPIGSGLLVLEPF